MSTISAKPFLLLSICFAHVINSSSAFSVFIVFHITFIILLILLKYMIFFQKIKTEILEEKQNLFHLCIKSHEETLQNLRYSDETICTICFEDFNKTDVCELNCSCHEKFYHLDCIKTWVYKNPTCPICRIRIYD